MYASASGSILILYFASFNTFKNVFKEVTKLSCDKEEVNVEDE